MIRIPFIRLALLVLVTLYYLGLAFASRYVGAWWTGAIGVGSPLLALLLALEEIGLSRPRRG